MGILKHLHIVYMIIFLIYIPYLHAIDSENINTKKRVNVQKSKQSKYRVNSFTDIKIEKKKEQKQEEKEEKAQEKQIATKKAKPIQKSHDAQLRYLQSLRYEVFSLKEQLGTKQQTSVPYGNYIDKKTSAQRFNALAQSYNDALKKSGLFAGVSMGVLDIYTSGYRDNQLVVTRITPLVYGGSGGYQKFFNHYVGTRLYGGLFTSFFNDVYTYDIKNGMTSLVPNPYGGKGNLESFYMLAFMSADVLFEFPLGNSFKHYIGGFMGLNIGIMYYRPYATHPQHGNYYPASYLWNYNLQVDYSLNLGMNLTFYNIHRIEFGLGIPFSYLSLPGFAESANTFETIPANFWRSAVFLLHYRLLIK